MRSFGVALVVVLAVSGAAAQSSAELRAVLEVRPVEATVGDPLEATIRVSLPQGYRLRAPRLGPEIGPFRVASGNWTTFGDESSEHEKSWSGRLVAFRPGELEIPAIELQVEHGGRITEVATEPLVVRIASVLSEEDRTTEDPQLADLKPPAAMPAEFGALGLALTLVGLLLALAALLWWLHRRYGSRFAAVPVSTDPFQRTPPHVWIYGELQRLLDRELPERGEIEAFHVELSRILKTYLGGRFRVDLLERTSEEVPVLLRPTGIAVEAIDETVEVLAQCDRVKFAGYLPEAPAWREAVDRIYRIVDTTKPAQSAESAERRGAA